MGLHLFRLGVYVNGFRGVLFTGKLVKTIFINRLPEYSGLFEPVKGDVPKLIHISPLFKIRGDKLRCIYSYVPCHGVDQAKCDGEPRIVKLNGLYSFYIGFSDKVVDYDKFLNAFTSLEDCFIFMDQRVCVSLTELEYRDPRIVSRTASAKALRDKKLKIVFASPTMLKDPFRHGKYKSLVPTVLNIFSTPLYIMLYSSGTLSFRRFRRQLMILHKIFNEPYSTLSTVKLRWVAYRKKPEPTIIGYTNLRINDEYLDYYGRFMNMEEYLAETLAYMTTLGIGVGRATGFGHIFLE